jgi:hypothetical protein
VLRADNLTTFMCRLSRNLIASTSWNRKGLSRPVMGLLYLTEISNFVKIHPLGAELFHAEGRRDTAKLVVAFHNFAIGPNGN